MRVKSTIINSKLNFCIDKFLEGDNAEHEEKLRESMDKMQQNSLLVYKLEDHVIECNELNNVEMHLEYLGKMKRVLNEVVQLIEEVDLALSFCKTEFRVFLF